MILSNQRGADIDRCVSEITTQQEIILEQKRLPPEMDATFIFDFNFLLPLVKSDLNSSLT